MPNTIVTGATGGAQFTVGTNANGDFHSPALTALQSGRFVAVWTAYNGNDADIIGQIFNADGTEAGGEFLLNTQTASDQFFPSITSLSDGRFVASWTDTSGKGGDASGYGVKAQIFNADGTKAGGEFLVNTQTAFDQYFPSITSLSDGRFVASWMDYSGQGGDASGSSVKAQIFNADGTKAGGEFLVNTQTRSDQFVPSITSLSDGRFVVSWTDSSGQGGDAFGDGIKAQIFNADGTKAGGEFLVNTQTGSDQFYPSITSLSDGRFVASWMDTSGQGGDAFGFGTKAQIFNADGTKAGGEFLVNSQTAGNQFYQSITSLSDGRFVVSWSDSSLQGGDASGHGIKAQIFNADGSKAGGEFLVNTQTESDQLYPSVSALSGGHGFVVSWYDAGTGSIEARTFALNEAATNAAPTLSLSSPAGSLTENIDTSAAVELATVAVADDGQGTNTLTLSGADAASFEIVNGKLNLKAGTALDFETKSSYSVTVNVDDPAVGSTPDDSETFTLTVADVNEKPTLTVNATPVVVREDVAAGAPIADVDATDPDLGGGNDLANDFENLTYSIVGGDPGGLFAIDAASGEISLAAGRNLDFETAQSHTLTVRATDGANAFDEETVVINVTDVNEGPSDADDTLVAEAGNETLDGMGGSDTIDMVNAGAGGSSVDLDSGIAFSSATGIDTLISIENVKGSVGDDVLSGDAGDNVFVATGGSDVINGRGNGASGDTFDASAATTGVAINLSTGAVSGGFTATLSNIENATGGDGADVITGSNAANTLVGNGGNDNLTGGAGNDAIDGGDGVDVARYASDPVAATAVAYNAATGHWSVTTGGETDNLVNVEQIDDAAGAGAKILLVGGGGYTSLASAIAAANAGDTIMVASGVLADTGSVEVNKAVTILGFNHGVEGGSGGRGAESVLNGGLYISADGVTIDGLNIVGGATNAGNASGIYVDHDNVTITNTILEGNGSVSFGFVTPFGGGVSGLTIDGNLVTNWAAGGYFNPTTQFTVTDNTFSGNGNNFVGDDWADGTLIDRNDFGQSVGSPIGYGVLAAEDDVGAYFGPDNTFENAGRKVGIFLYGAEGEGQNVTGTDLNDRFFTENAAQVRNDTLDGALGDDSIEAGLGDDELDGGEGEDTLNGGDGDDTLTGSAGSDTIDGGNGVDIARFSGDAADYTIAKTGPGAFTVTDATGGVDTITGVERLSFDDGDILYVGEGGYATIQAAVDAAGDNDTIVVAAGPYRENVTITDKAITIIGANEGVGGAGSRGAESSIIGRVVVQGTKDVTLDGLEFRADGLTGTAGASNPALNFRGSGDYVVENSVFYNAINGGNSEARAIGLYTDLSGGVTIDDNLFTGASTGNFSTAPWHRGIWSDGTSSDLNIFGNTFLHVRSSMNLDFYNNATHEVSGNNFREAGTGIAVGGIPTGPSFTGIHDNTFDNVGDEFNFRNVTTPITVDLDATGNESTSGMTTRLLGGQAGDSLGGTDGADIIVADGFVAPEPNASTLGGADTVNGGDGNDTVVGGLGNDQISGGDGDDTAAYARARSEYTVTTVTDGSGNVTGFATVTDNNTANGNDGTDQLTSVENLVFANGVTLDVDDEVRLFNGNGELIDTFDNLEDAVTAASSGDSIELASGDIALEGAVKDGFVTIDKDLTITGAGRDATTIGAVTDTGAGFGLAMIRVSAGAELDIADLTIDGNDQSVGDVDVSGGIYFEGDGSVTNVRFTNIGADVMDEPRGDGITVSGGTVAITDSVFDQLERAGVRSFDGATVTITDSDFTAKTTDDAEPVGASLNFGVLTDGTTVSITGGTFTGFAAIQNGFGSAAIASGSSDPANPADLTVSGVTFTNNSVAIAFGFSEDDDSELTISGVNNVTSSVAGALALAALGDVAVSGVENLVGPQAIVDWDGGDGANVIAGAANNDTLAGNDGDDVITGNEGDDQITGGAGNDTANVNVATDGADTVNLGTGDDVVNVDGGGQVRVTFVSADVGNGDPNDANDTDPRDLGLAVRLQAEDGAGDPAGPVGRYDDEGISFVAAAGTKFDVRDLVSEVQRGNQFDVVTLGTVGNDSIDAGTVVGSTLNYYVNAGTGNDTIETEDGDDFLVGGAGNDSLIGGLGNDSFIGGGGNDRFIGGGGNDTVLDGGGGAGDDTAVLNVTTGGSDTIDLGAGNDRVEVSADGGGQVRLTFTSAEVGNGSVNDGGTLANQDGGLAVRVQSEDGSDGLTGDVSRVDDEGVTFVADAGVTFDVRDLTNLAQRGDQFTTATLGTNAADVTAGTSGNDYVNAGQQNDNVSGLVGNDFLVGGAGDDTLSGGADNDSFIGGVGADAIDGGAGTDTAIYTGAGSISRNATTGQWQVTADGVTEQLTGIERVVISTGPDAGTYLLVDKAGAVGGFQSVQAAVDAATGGETILIAPGSYTEIASLMPYGDTGGLLIDKAGLTLQGVDVDGAAITTAEGARADGATIIPGQEAGFGGNIFVGPNGDGVTIRGLHLKAGPETTNKLLEFWGDDVTIEGNFIDTLDVNGDPSYAAAIYINEVTGQPITTYLIQNNILNEGIYVANGVGDGDAGEISTAQQILNNYFETAGFDPNDPNTLGRYDMVAVQGVIPGLGYQDDPAQVPTISGNIRSDNSAPFIFRMTEQSAARFPNLAEVEAIVAANTDADTTYAYVIDGDTVEVKLVESDGINRLYVSNGLDTLNRFLDGTPDGVSGGSPRLTMEAGDTIVVQSGSETVDSQIMVNGLTVLATENSADLNLTLATTLVDGTTTVVNTLELADYATGQGADVDVTGNLRANTIVGNSGDNELSGAAGNDRLLGRAGEDALFGDGGDDVLEGGAGSDFINGGTNTAVGDTAVFAGDFEDYTITRSGNVYTVVRGAETDIVTNVENFKFGNADPVSVVGNPDVIVQQGPSIVSITEAGVDEDTNPATIRVAENSANGTDVAAVQASDRNLPAGDDLTFRLENADGSLYTGPFSIVEDADGDSAIIEVSGPINFEDAASANFFVSVTDASGVEVRQAVTVGILNVNEAPTDLTFDSNPVDENDSTGPVVAEITVVGPDDDLTFTVSDSRFEVRDEGGALVLALKDGETLDFEDDAPLSVTVRATHADGEFIEEAFQVDLQDVNEAPTIVSLSDDSVDEETPGATVGVLTVSDPDGDTLEFTVDDDDFEVVEIAGEQVLKLKDGVELDFETDADKTVTVTVTADDGEFQDSATFTIDINNIDEAPVGDATQDATLEEGSTEAPLDIEALTDPDGQLTYRVAQLPTVGMVLLAGVAIDLGDLLTATQLEDLVFTSPDGTSGAETLGFDAIDPLGNETPLTVTINVTPAEARTYNGTGAAERIDGAGLNDLVNGLGGNDTLLGGGGNDTLNGGSGIDTMIGGTGNDTFLVNDAGDVVVEAANGGRDTVATNVSYTLGAGVSVEELRTTNSLGTGAIDLTGNEFDNLLLGNEGVNVLDGKAGADTMRGGLGDDTYFVDNAGDVVTELNGGGADTVAVRAGGAVTSYSLAAGSHVELLRTSNNTGTQAINLSGNEFANQINGNSAGNSLSGGGGTDVLYGLIGNDTLIGGAGADTLYGGVGNDTFVFDQPLGSIDRITDFEDAPSSGDLIQLSQSVFTAIAGPGSLSPNAFRVGAAAQDSDDRIIYNSANGRLLYDADGQGGAAATQIAILRTGLTLTADDFTVV